MEKKSVEEIINKSIMMDANDVLLSKSIDRVKEYINAYVEDKGVRDVLLGYYNILVTRLMESISEHEDYGQIVDASGLSYMDIEFIKDAMKKK